jgi:hypothetical protein
MEFARRGGTTKARSRARVAPLAWHDGSALQQAARVLECAVAVEPPLAHDLVRRDRQHAVAWQPVRGDESDGIDVRQQPDEGSIEVEDAAAGRPSGHSTLPANEQALLQFSDQLAVNAASRLFHPVAATARPREWA